MKKIELEIATNLDNLIYILKKEIFRSIITKPKKNIIFGEKRKNDGIIDWRMNADNINKLVEALGKPYAGASFIFKNKEVKVGKLK